MLIPGAAAATITFLYLRPAAGSRAGQHPAGEEQGPGVHHQAPAGSHRGPDPGDRGDDCPFQVNIVKCTR